MAFEAFQRVDARSIELMLVFKVAVIHTITACIATPSNVHRLSSPMLLELLSFGSELSRFVLGGGDKELLADAFVKILVDDSGLRNLAISWESIFIFRAMRNLFTIICSLVFFYDAIEILLDLFNLRVLI